MDPLTFLDPNLTKPDLLVLNTLLADVDQVRSSKTTVEDNASDEGYDSGKSSHKDGVAQRKKTAKPASTEHPDETLISELRSLNDPSNDNFEPTILSTWDINLKTMRPGLARSILTQYVRIAQMVVRNKTDVIMLTHLMLYFTTSLPSAILLYWNFSYLHGVLHVAMQVWFAGPYTLMMHQHIHMGGVLDKKYAWFDRLFPFITDPLHGHTWNSYYYHHVKHHHVEGNGPDDLSSTIRYQRDNVWHFLHYWGKFFFFVWFDLPGYFLRKNKPTLALRAGGWEISEYVTLFLLASRVNFRATLFAFLLPLFIMRIGLMVGNWAQHAFVDEIDPNSDFRSSITVIDVPTNRHCYNDGYHTSHHLNPRRHWRDHQESFIRQRETYANEQALVFRNIDWFFLTIRLLRKDYDYLARCLVPIGDQINMSLDEIAAMLRTKTRAFSDEDIREKFAKGK